jgi:trk system potassium uptake protein TrkA
MRHFAVIGLGRFGSQVVRSLYETGHRVLAIDSDPEAVQRIKDSCTQAVVLDARDKQRLRALGIRDYDAVVVSLGESIEASALVALHLKDIGVKRIIAKAGSDDHARLLELIGVDEIITPERQAAERLAARLRDAAVLDYIPLGRHHSIHELAPPEEFLDKSLEELRLRNRFGVHVLAVRDSRTGEVEVNPPAGFRIHAHHILVLLGRNEDLDRLKGRR